MVREGLRNLLAALALGALLACGIPPGPTTGPVRSARPPAAPREFRAAWVATVANIDWPSARGLPVAAQQAEARALINRARTLGLNAIILQVRPAADALYASTLEPWSEYLTGTQGRAPQPFYDPLAFWLEEAHRAGLELHAWFNPYRARHETARSPLAASHLATARPELVRTYGNQLWLDPSVPEAADHVVRVLLDVVRRYDIDGVHVDDYFYPYPIKDAAGLRVDFPDEGPWQAYLAGGGSLARADWRRAQVNGLIERLAREVHRTKAHVRIGVSPFGLGRPDRRPPGVAGFSQYDELYADAERWLAQGWVDYLMPQLYWKREAPEQPFAPLLAYWRSQNLLDRHVWPGLFTSRTTQVDLPWPAEEIVGQIQIARSGTGAPGHAHFSLIALKKDPGGLGALLQATYGGPALVPAAPWLGGTPPAVPSVRLRRAPSGATVRVEGPGPTPWLLALWAHYGGEWRFFTLPGTGGLLPASHEGQPLDNVLVSAVGRTGLESLRVTAADERD